eukprot:362502-Chlamydomonas_euryale.AAC.2
MSTKEEPSWDGVTGDQQAQHGAGSWVNNAVLLVFMDGWSPWLSRQSCAPSFRAHCHAATGSPLTPSRTNPIFSVRCVHTIPSTPTFGRLPDIHTGGSLLRCRGRRAGPPHSCTMASS